MNKAVHLQNAKLPHRILDEFASGPKEETLRTEFFRFVSFRFVFSLSFFSVASVRKTEYAMHLLRRVLLTSCPMSECFECALAERGIRCFKERKITGRQDLLEAMLRPTTPRLVWEKLQ